MDWFSLGLDAFSLTAQAALYMSFLCRLTGRLESVMGPIDFAAEVPAEGTFDCVARTGKGDMRLTGERVGGNEEP